MSPSQASRWLAPHPGISPLITSTAFYRYHFFFAINLRRGGYALNYDLARRTLVLLLVLAARATAAVIFTLTWIRRMWRRWDRMGSAARHHVVVYAFTVLRRRRSTSFFIMYPPMRFEKFLISLLAFTSTLLMLPTHACKTFTQIAQWYTTQEKAFNSLVTKQTCNVQVVDLLRDSKVQVHPHSNPGSPLVRLV